MYAMWDPCLPLLREYSFLAVFFLKDPEDSNLDGPPYKINREAVEEYFGNDFDLRESFIPETHYECRPKGSEYLCWMQLK